ncbi:MAG: hypothetical protein U0359_08890 [Byssovorax sp.]
MCVLSLASCDGKKGSGGAPAPAGSAGPVSAAVSVSAREQPARAVSSASAANSPAPSVAPSSAPSSAVAAPGRPPASAKEACQILKGPIQLSFTGAATVWPSEDGGPERDPHIVFNRDGIPKAVTLPAQAAVRADASARAPGSAAGSAAGSAPGSASARAALPERLALAEPAERATTPGCAIGGGSLFCMAQNGDIHRTTLSGDGDTVVARGRPGTPVAASTIGRGQVVYAFLADKKTSEGIVSQAFAAIDDAAPATISEDGSGATFITLAPRGEAVVAMYIDARRAMTPLHARVLHAEPGHLRAGNDAVLFVGEGSETRVAGALALGESGPTFGLLPGFKDTTTFGIAAIRIDETPKDDAPVTWSTYPSGMDRAAVAATRGSSPRRVLLSRPATNDPKSKKLLELGEIEESGAFRGLCTVAEGSSFTDLGVTADRFGTLWLTYTDASGTWIERRGKAF